MHLTHHNHAMLSAEQVYAMSGVPLPTPRIEPGWYYSIVPRKWYRCTAIQANELKARKWEGVAVAYVEG